MADQRNPVVVAYVEYERANRRRSPRTLEQKELVLGDLSRFLAARLRADVTDSALLLCAELADLVAWQQSLGSRLKDSSAATYTCAVRAFYKWAGSKQSGRLVPENPAEELPVPQRPKSVPRPIGDEDLYRALDLAAAANPRMYCWLLLEAACSLRCCEIAGLDQADVRIDERANAVSIEIKDSKGRKDRVVVGGPAVVAALRPFLRRQRGPLFTMREQATGQTVRIAPYLVSNLINKFLHKEVGVADTAHSLRHWFGSASYAARRDLRATQEAMGHASPTTTAGYAAIVDGHDGSLGQELDTILRTRGRIDPRKAHLRPVPAAEDRFAPEHWVLRMRVEGHPWEAIAETFAITVDRARQLVATVFDLDQQAS